MVAARVKFTPKLSPKLQIEYINSIKLRKALLTANQTLTLKHVKPPLALSMLDKHLLNVGYFPQGRQNEKVNFLFIPKITESQMMYIPNGLFPQIFINL